MLSHSCSNTGGTKPTTAECVEDVVVEDVMGKDGSFHGLDCSNCFTASGNHAGETIGIHGEAGEGTVKEDCLPKDFVVVGSSAFHVVSSCSFSSASSGEINHVFHGEEDEDEDEEERPNIARRNTSAENSTGNVVPRGRSCWTSTSTPCGKEVGEDDTEGEEARHKAIHEGNSNA